MTALVKPAVVFDVTDRGGDYFAKLQALAGAVDTAFDAFNQQIVAAETAEQIRVATAQLHAQTQQLVADAVAITQSGLPAQAGRAGAVFVTNGAAANWKKTDGSEGTVLHISAVAGINEKLAEIEVYAMGTAL